MSYFIPGLIEYQSQTPLLPGINSAFEPPARNFVSPPREPARGQLVFLYSIRLNIGFKSNDH